MRAHVPNGWNTWDYRGFNRVVYLAHGRTKIAVRYAVWDETVVPDDPPCRERGHLHDTFRWPDVRRIGPHAPLGLPARLDFAVEGTGFRADATADGDTLRLTVEPLAPTDLRVVFMIRGAEGERLRRLSPAKGALGRWLVETSGADWPTDYFLNIPEWFALAPPGRPATIVIHPKGHPVGHRPAADAFARYEAQALRGDGALADAPQAMTRVVHWNTHFDVRRGLVSSPVSRDWCIDWNGPIIFGWDAFFAALTASVESPDLARLNVEAVLAGVDQLGFVPNYFMSHGAASLDRSMPCLGAYAVWKINQMNADREWLSASYRRLRVWHRFWMKHRNGRGDGLLAWGSNPRPRYAFPQLLGYNPSLQHTAKCAMYEAGLDNSPMYDDVPFNTETNTLELDDVMLNSYYTLDCDALSRIAAALGKDEEAAAYARECDVMVERINERFWDDEQGIYANRHWDGRFSTRWSPSSFFPLLAGVPDEHQAKQLVERHLLNDAEFWGEYVVPSIARNDPAYADNDYWRGRIWGPFNFLVAEGLRRYRFDAAAAELARRGLAMFLRNWHEDGGVYENYNADTGQGGDVWNAARLYHWGGLLALIAVGELADAEPGGYLRFGSIAFEDAAIRNLRLGGDVYDVELGAGVLVRRNEAPFLECPTRVIVRLPLARSSAAPIEIRADGPGAMTLHDRRWAGRSARINAGEAVAPAADREAIVYRWT